MPSTLPNQSMCTSSDLRLCNSRALSKEQMELINSMSIEEAYERGLFDT